MKTILVTGGAGFIGANFVHYWLDNNVEDRVVVLDALTYAGNLASLEPVVDRPAYRFVHGDIRDQALVTDLVIPTGNIIVHSPRTWSEGRP